MHLALAVWFSPMFPIGAFAYSHGLEWAHEAGDLHDADTLRDWLATLITHGAPRNDAILLAQAYRATLQRDGAALSALNDLALAMATSGERRLETTTQGNAFWLAAAKSWPCDTLALIERATTPDIAYPIVVALVAVGHDAPLPETARMFCLGFVSNLVSAAIRLGVVGQSDGQRTIAALLPAIETLANDSVSRTLDDLGAHTFRSDLASLRHETQYTRLFRS